MCNGEPVKLEVTERCVATGFYNKDKPIQPGKDHLHDGVILLQDQSSLRCCFIMKIMVIVVLSPLGLLDVTMKEKTVNSGQNDAIVQMAYFKLIFRLSLLKISLF